MINYLSLKDIVYEYISGQIRSKALEPGERINEQSICEALQISRTPVREALIQLAYEGYIRQIPRRGFVVETIDSQRARHIYRIIGVLEALAAVECLKRPDGVDTVELEKLVIQMDEAIDTGAYERYYELQNQFHDTYIKTSDSEDLIRILDSLKKIFIKQSYSEMGQGEYFKEILHKTNAQHSEIVALFKKGDAEVLRRYIRDVHWDTTYADMETLV
ncbi:MAG: hypothetical protein AVO33_00510 [delta proteobacterium ML8_F1]|nr:MAG: hypothetical protein AVO33_00510 [delta proteobacterium ML8_F1]